MLGYKIFTTATICAATCFKSSFNIFLYKFIVGLLLKEILHCHQISSLVSYQSPIYCLPYLFATLQLVPLPTNGSSTTSPSAVPHNIIWELSVMRNTTARSCSHIPNTSHSAFTGIILAITMTITCQLS